MSNQENISKETKKTRRKKSQRKAQQIKLAVIMIMVSVLVLSASTFAWYKMSKTADIQNMQFTADTLGNLLISEDGSAYSNSINLFNNNNSAILLPATTEDGKEFWRPEYSDDGEWVNTVAKLTDDSADNYISFEGKNYIYVKEFFIKSGVNQGSGKTYELKLSDGGKNGNVFNSGTYLIDSTSSEVNDSVNAVRVSFVVGENVASSNDVVVFEPYNTGTGVGTKAQINEVVETQFLTDSELDYNEILISQNESGQLMDGRSLNSVLTEIEEGVSVKITMFVWFEGMDDDCVNEIALDTLKGQIQFEAVEITD